MCHTSNYVIGAVLRQRVGRAAYVIYYALRTLDSAQCNYSTIEKELLAIIFALEKFCSYLLGTKVIVFFLPCSSQIFARQKGSETETHPLDPTTSFFKKKRKYTFH